MSHPPIQPGMLVMHEGKLLGHVEKVDHKLLQVQPTVGGVHSWVPFSFIEHVHDRVHLKGDLEALHALEQSGMFHRDA